MPEPGDVLLVDAHTHLDKYTDDEIDGVLDSIREHRILSVSVSVDVPSFLRTEAIAAEIDLVIPAFGIQPWEASRYVDSLGELEGLVATSPLIGEIGLDHRFVTDEANYEAQDRVFAWFLGRARAEGKLVSVHSAGAERETASMLRQYGIDRAVMHWYSGPLDVLGELIADGLMFSVGIEILYSDHIRDIARAIPTDQLLTETDNPGGPKWLTGEPGYPPLIADVVEELARVRCADRHELMEAVSDNFQGLIQADRHLVAWVDRLG